MLIRDEKPITKEKEQIIEFYGLKPEDEEDDVE